VCLVLFSLVSAAFLANKDVYKSNISCIASLFNFTAGKICQHGTTTSLWKYSVKAKQSRTVLEKLDVAIHNHHSPNTDSGKVRQVNILWNNFYCMDNT